MLILPAWAASRCFTQLQIRNRKGRRLKVRDQILHIDCILLVCTGCFPAIGFGVHTHSRYCSLLPKQAHTKAPSINHEHLETPLLCTFSRSTLCQETIW